MLSESQKADIGVIGLAVMGENLVLNLESRGYTVAVFNLTYVDGHARTMRYNGTGIYDDGSFYHAAKKAPVVQYR